MQNFSHLAARVLNTPLLLEPSYARVFFNALSSRLGITQIQDHAGLVTEQETLKVTRGGDLMADGFGGSAHNVDAPYTLHAGVAVLPISGTLVHKHGYLRPYSGMTGYDGVVARVAHAAGNHQVKGILLDFDTPGGEVAGCFDAAQKIRSIASAAGKPLWSLCYDMHCSAGMALASAGSRRLITQTAVAGSVGVLMAHASFQKQLEDEGIKVTLIHSGQFKVDGNPYEDLPADVLNKFQSKSDALRNEFAGLVASMLNMDIAAILATEAGTYRGQDAIDIGFADQLVNGNDAVDEFIDYLSNQGSTLTLGGPSMSKDTKQPVAAQQPETASATAENPPTATEIFGSVGAVDPGAIATSATAERARVEQILGSDESKGKAKLANHLAFKTDLSADAAIAVMAEAAADGSVSGDNTLLDAAMASTRQPNAGLIAVPLGDSASQAAAIMGDYHAATGKSKK